MKAVFIGGPLHGMRTDDGPGGAFYAHTLVKRVDHPSPTLREWGVPWTILIGHFYRLARMQRDRRVWLYHGTKRPTPGGG